MTSPVWGTVGRSLRPTPSRSYAIARLIPAAAGNTLNHESMSMPAPLTNTIAGDPSPASMEATRRPAIVANDRGRRRLAV